MKIMNFCKKHMIVLCLLSCFFLSATTVHASSKHETASYTKPNSNSTEYDGFSDFVEKTYFTIDAGDAKYTPYLFYPNHARLEPNDGDINLNLHNEGSTTFTATLYLYDYDTGARIGSNTVTARPNDYGWCIFRHVNANDRYYIRIKNTSSTTATGFLDIA